MADPPSSPSSTPPAVAGDQIAANELKQPAHPLWQRAAGRSQTDTKVENERTKFEPLSALALELGGFRQAVDGRSTLFSESARSVSHAGRRRKHKQQTFDEDEDDEDSGEECDDDEDDKKQKKRKTTDGAGMYAQAAFGGGFVDDDDRSASDASEASSARKKKAYDAAFPVRGIDCVGCSLANKIGPVTSFIKTNLEMMSEQSLFKMAALIYVREVQEPRRREGVLTPGWSWKDVRCHYLMHCSDQTIARTFCCRTLQTMRYAVESRLMRVDGGEREIDKTGVDLVLKIIKAESQERTILAGLGKNRTPGSTVGGEFHPRPQTPTPDPNPRPQPPDPRPQTPNH